MEKIVSPKSFHSKHAEVKDLIGFSDGSNKQSKDEEANIEHLHIISYCDSNNNSLGNNKVKKIKNRL